MLYRDIARLGVLSFKLHVNAIQSPVHYYQIYKKKLCCRDGNRTDDVLFQFFFHDLFHLRKSLEFSPNVSCFMLLTYIATVGSYNDVSQFGPNDTLVQRESYRKYNS